MMLQNPISHKSQDVCFQYNNTHSEYNRGGFRRQPSGEGQQQLKPPGSLLKNNTGKSVYLLITKDITFRS